MGLKEMLKNNFSKEKKITTERYKAAKFMFIISSFVFFLNFYLVGAQFFLVFFAKTLGVTYILLILSFLLYFFFFIKKMLLDKVPKYFFIFVIALLGLLFIFLMLPLIINGGIIGVIGLLSFNIYL